MSAISYKLPTSIVASVSLEPPRLVVAYECIVKLEKLKSYGANWGGNKEKAVNSQACDQAMNFISFFAFWRPHVSLHVYPTAGGEIGLDWECEGKDYSVLFSGSGSEVLLLIDENDDHDVEKTFADNMELLGELKVLGFDGI